MTGFSRRMSTIILALCLVLACGAVGVRADELPGQGYPDAHTAIARLEASFDTAPDGSVIYPDNYAGCWVSGLDLHVNLTTGDRYVQQYEYGVRLDYPGSFIVYNTVPYSLNQLRNYQSVGVQVTGASSSRIDVRNNRVVLEADIPREYYDYGYPEAVFWGSGIPLCEVDGIFEIYGTSFV